MNEFDRFARHQLKPQAFVRYGDDFLLFYPTRRQAYLSRKTATDFLAGHLKLTVNVKNDIVIAASHGLKFLGHTIKADSLIVDSYTTNRVVERLSWHNASSYRSLPLAKLARDSLDWILLENYVDI